MNRWIRAGMGFLVVAAVVLVTGLLLPLTVEQDESSSIDCGSALFVEDNTQPVAVAGACEAAATDRRTLVYLVAGGIGGIGLICIGLGQPQTPGRRNPHPFA